MLHRLRENWIKTHGKARKQLVYDYRTVCGIRCVNQTGRDKVGRHGRGLISWAININILFRRLIKTVSCLISFEFNNVFLYDCGPIRIFEITLNAYYGYLLSICLQHCTRRNWMFMAWKQNEVNLWPLIGHQRFMIRVHLCVRNDFAWMERKSEWIRVPLIPWLISGDWFLRAVLSIYRIDHLPTWGCSGLAPNPHLDRQLTALGERLSFFLVRTTLCDPRATCSFDFLRFLWKTEMITLQKWFQNIKLCTTYNVQYDRHCQLCEYYITTNNCVFEYWRARARTTTCFDN